MKLIPPTIVLFDWHATLVDTLDAMYRAVDDMLPQLAEHRLLQRMVGPNQSKSPDDARLVEYVREYAQLHPKIKADRIKRIARGSGVREKDVREEHTFSIF